MGLHTLPPAELLALRSSLPPFDLLIALFERCHFASDIAAALRARSARCLSIPRAARVLASETGGTVSDPPVFPFLPRPGPARRFCPRVPFANLPPSRSSFRSSPIQRSERLRM